MGHPDQTVYDTGYHKACQRRTRVQSVRFSDPGSDLCLVSEHERDLVGTGVVRFGGIE